MPIKRVSKGVAIKAERDEESGYHRIYIREARISSSQVALAVTAHIFLPELLLRKATQLDPNSSKRIYSFAFESDRLFLTMKQLEQSVNSSLAKVAPGLLKKIGSHILSASIGEIKLEKLTIQEEMRGAFRILSSDPGGFKCAHWDFSMEGLCYKRS